ncbi:MAG: hypothetical protein ACJ73D_07975 [Pyrinomonadaceae bacterium]
MMRILLLCLAITFIALAASAQTSPPPLPELTNLEEFSSRSGTLIQREFTRIGDVAGLRVDVVKVTDLIGRVSAKGVRISANLGPTGRRD